MSELLPPLTWKLDAQWPVFAGHFPGQPVLPGALLLDWVLTNITQQTGTAVAQVSQCKFVSTALPGEQLLLEFQPTAQRVRFQVLALQDAGYRLVASGVATLKKAQP